MFFGSMRFRRRLFVDPAVQGAVVRRSFLHLLLAVAVASVFLLIIEVLSQGVDKPISHHLASIWSRYAVLVIVMLIVFPVFAYDSVRMSHRFVGPIFALRTALRKLADGERVPELAFRKDDFWNDLARDVNRLAARLDQQQVSRKPAEEDAAPAKVATSARR
jgi:hypothetical protein